MRVLIAKGWVRRGIFAALGLALVAAYWWGAEQHLHRVNTKVWRTDQSAYLAYARNMAETNYEFVGGRNRMPIYPFLLSQVYTPELSEEAFFVRAKYLNIVISLLVLCGTWGLMRWWLPSLEASVLTLIAAFSVFVYKAAYAQSELLFYGVNFAVFLLLLRCLRRPSMRIALLCGVMAGVAYLTKASVPPMLAVFLGWSGVAVAVSFRKWWRTSLRGSPWHAPWMRQVLSAGLVVVAFLVTVSPYIYTSKQVFGRWFYNVNSTFYIWYDSWEEAKAGTRLHGDREHWPAMPADQIPGPGKYFREHSLNEIAGRVVNGLVAVVSRAAPYYLFLFPYLVLCVAVVRRWPEQSRQILLEDGRWIVSGFVASYGAVYLLLYAFYAPISRQPRLILALFLPVMLSLGYFLSRPEWRDAPLAKFRGMTLRPRNAHYGLLAFLGLLILTAYPILILNVYTGW